jgi:Zn-dependent protease with chaperone function
LNRFRLTVLAVAGDIALTAVMVLPWFAVIFFGVVLTNRVFFYWMGAAALVFLVWLLRPSFKFDGRKLPREEAPELHAELDALRQKLQVPGRMHVFLDDSFNAGAAESRGLLGLLGTRRILILGIPLLAVLSREQALAVVAHEFGHFSRRHGRLGHWLYRARVGWIRFAEQIVESDSSFDRAAAWYAKKFVPYFSTRCFVHSRQCEYEADADAASIVGSACFSEALTRVAVVACAWNELLPREIRDWQLRESEPPADFYERFSIAVQCCTHDQRKAWLDQCLESVPTSQDTHPGLAERLQSLKEGPRLADFAASAGAALLGPAWPAVLSEFNARWSGEARSEWVIEHLRLKHVMQPLAAVDPATIGDWNAEKRLRRAKALRLLEPAAGLGELRSLHLQHPRNERITFAFGAALLNEGDDAGIEILSALARNNVAMRFQAYLRLLAYFERKGNTEQIERYSTLANRVARRQTEAARSFLSDAEEGRVAVSSLPPDMKSFLAQASNADSCIVAAWLFEATTQLPMADYKTSLPVVAHGLALAIDPEELKRNGSDEAQVAERYEAALASLTPPDQITVVRTFFKTEKATMETWRARPMFLLEIA